MNLQVAVAVMPPLGTLPSSATSKYLPSDYHHATARNSTKFRYSNRLPQLLVSALRSRHPIRYYEKYWHEPLLILSFAVRAERVP
ncbi:hypothetical protein BH10PLA2_BH10PLA2_13380 [soil metagenome]